MKRPNILFLLADDLGWRDLGVDGSDFYESPRLDALAHGGMRFTQGYAACQVCSPSRASLLTGQYTPRHGVTDYIGAPTGEAWRKWGRETKLLPPDYAPGLQPGEVTFAEALRRDGYRTFFAGKWHLGEGDSTPEQFGFEINKGGWRVGWPEGGYFSPWINPTLPSGPDGESLPIRLAKETAHFMASHKDEPFLAYLSFYSVHSPIQTSQDRWEKFRKKAVAQNIAHNKIASRRDQTRFTFDRRLPVRQVQDCPIYAGMIEAMDDAVGIVLDALEQLGLAENTIVCFTSDNGGVSSGDAYSSSMLPLRGGKGRQWEGGIREPFYIRYPRYVSPGSTCDVPVSGIDVYPTLLELAGVPCPPQQVIDGLSITPLLRGETSDDLTQRDLFWHYPHYGNQGGDPSSIIRAGQWKLIHYYEDSRDELYDLQADPGEQTDLAATNPERAATLRSRLDDWLTELNATVPTPDPLHDPAKEQAYRHTIEHEFMPQLEAEHAAYLDPNWQPNDDWWGSQVVID